MKIRTIRTRRAIVSFTDEKNDHKTFLFFDKKKSPYLPPDLIKNLSLKIFPVKENVYFASPEARKKLALDKLWAYAYNNSKGVIKTNAPT